MAKLFRCRICGDPYIGETQPSRCPFCGAYRDFIVEASEYKETFDVELNEKDKENVQKALSVEISNASFYFCAAEKTDDEQGRQLFKALGKVEAEHASIWRKILKLPKQEIEKLYGCSESNDDNLKESHSREQKAIEFYRQAEAESENQRVKQLFSALVSVEKDHLEFSEDVK